jgi:hypothetical protein
LPIFLASNASPRQWSDLGRFLSDAMYEGSPDTGKKYDNLIDLYKEEPKWVEQTVNGEIGRNAGKAFLSFLNLKSRVNFDLVPKVFNFTKESKEVRDKIIIGFEQLG